MTDIYSQAKSDFENEDVLYHFTSFNALKSILHSKKFRLSSLSIVNDPDEMIYLDNIWKKKVFIISFTNKIDDYFWDNYVKSTKEGVCISIRNKNLDNFTCYDENNNKFKSFIDNGNKSVVNHKSYDKNEDWEIYDISCLKVLYTDYIEEYRDYRYDLIDIFSNCENLNKQELISEFSSIKAQGFIKSKKKWEQESEYRVRITVRPIGQEQYFVRTIKHTPTPPFDYIYVDISKIINQIKIFIKKDFMFLEELEKLCSCSGIYFEII